MSILSVNIKESCIICLRSALIATSYFSSSHFHRRKTSRFVVRGGGCMLELTQLKKINHLIGYTNVLYICDEHWHTALKSRFVCLSIHSTIHTSLQFQHEVPRGSLVAATPKFKVSNTSVSKFLALVCPNLLH